MTLLMELELRTSGEGSDPLYQLSHHHHCLSVDKARTRMDYLLNLSTLKYASIPILR